MNKEHHVSHKDLGHANETSPLQIPATIGYLRES
jgi:hypothetical protein